MKPGTETRTSPLSKHSLYNVYNRKTPDKEGKTCITGGKAYLIVITNIGQLWKERSNSDDQQLQDQ